MSEDWESNARIYSLLAEKTRHLRIINDLAFELLRLDSVDEVLWVIAKSAIANLKFEDCIIYLVDETGRTLVQRAAHGPKNPIAKEIKDPITIPIAEGIVGSVAQTGRPELILDTSEDPRYIVDDAARASEVAVPIIHDDKVIGVIDSEHERAGFYTEEHVEILTIIASITSTKLASCMLIEELTSTVSKLKQTQATLEAKEKELEYLSTHDPLTDLYNRRALLTSGNELIAKSNKTGKKAGVWYIDLDHFRLVNDRYGHTTGDKLLQHLAGTFRDALGEQGIVSRIGGDEFVVLLPDMNAEESIDACSSLIERVSQTKFMCEGNHVTIGLSVGITEISRQVPSLATVIEAADKGSFIAKQSGRNQYHLITQNDLVYQEYIDRATRAMEIAEALESDRLLLYAQPIVPTGDSGASPAPIYECLLRMVRGNGEIVEAKDFIQTSERYGQINALDRWVIHEVLGWTGDHRDSPLISINVSGASVSDPTFLGFLLQELDAMDVSEPKICIEITETSAISNLSLLVQLVDQLKKAGILVALDDFGSGYASFELLKRLNIDLVKIDRVFIETVGNDIDRKMVRHINDVAHLIGAKTIAEGVEDEGTFHILKEIGIDYAQGFYFSHPVPLPGIYPPRPALSR